MKRHHFFCKYRYGGFLRDSTNHFRVNLDFRTPGARFPLYLMKNDWGDPLPIATPPPLTHNHTHRGGGGGLYPSLHPHRYTHTHTGGGLSPSLGGGGRTLIPISEGGGGGVPPWRIYIYVYIYIYTHRITSRCMSAHTLLFLEPIYIYREILILYIMKVLQDLIL